MVTGAQKSLRKKGAGRAKAGVRTGKAKQSDDIYRQLAEASADFIYVIDRNLKVKYVNPAGAAVLGMSQKEVTGKSLKKLFPLETAKKMIGSVRRVFETGKPLADEFTHQFFSGNFYSHVALNPLLDEDGKVKAVMGISRDINELKKTEQLLRESEECYRMLNENAPLGIITCDTAGNITTVNQKVLDIFAVPSVAMIRALNLLNFEPLVAAGIAGDITDCLSLGQLVVRERPYICIAGPRRFLRYTLAPTISSAGNITGMQGIFEDVTERRVAQDALKASEQRFRALFEGAGSAIFVADVATEKIIDCNKKAEELVGRRREQIIGLHQKQLHPAEMADKHAEMFKWHAAEGGMNNYEAFVQHSDGRAIPVIINAKLMKIDGQKILIGFFLDIADLKRAEDALRESEEKFRVLADTSSASIWLYQDDMYVFTNKAATEMTGYSREELGRMRTWEIYHPDCRELIKERSRARQHGETVPSRYDAKLLTKSGETRWVEINAGRVDYGGRPANISTLFDITDRRRAGEAIRRNEELLAKSQEAARLGNWIWDVRKDEITGSPENVKILGMPAGVSSTTMKTFLQMVHPGDRDMVSRDIDAVLQGKEKSSIDFRIFRLDGSMIFLNTLIDQVVCDREGKVTQIYGINQDITERKQIEEQLREAREQAELYLDLMGHDINNMNQVAMGYLEIVMASPRLDKELYKISETALQAIQSSSRLIANVRKLQRERSGTYAPMVFDLGGLLEEVCGQYKSIPGKHVEISCGTRPGILVQADELLRDVFVNLVDNAIKHTDGRTFINIRMVPESRNGRQYCTVSVEDNGPGIPDALKDKIFERLRRGETRARGSGIGLYLVNSLVDSYGGKVWVEDRVQGDSSKGARFQVLLPMVQEKNSSN